MDGPPDAEAYRYGAHLRARHPKTGELAATMNGVIAFQPWDWWIGTGFFNDDIDAVYWETARRAKSPPAIWTCRAAPKARPVRSNKRRRRWKN